MSIDTQLEYLSEAVEDQETPITKQEMEQMLVGIQKSKELKTYRQVDQAPVVVDVVDISDAAAKKLAQKLKPESDNTPTAVESDKNKSPGLLSKIIDFAKGSFINIIKMIGGVVGWVVGTITSVISGVTNWVLSRIQKAMIFSIAKSASNMGGRFSKLGLLVKAAGAASAGLAMYNVYEGISTFQSKLDSVNDAATTAFVSPESILTTGMTKFPEFTSTDTQPSTAPLQSDQSDSPSSNASIQSEEQQVTDQSEPNQDNKISNISTDSVIESLSTTPQQSPMIDAKLSPDSSVDSVPSVDIQTNNTSADTSTLPGIDEPSINEDSVTLINKETPIDTLNIPSIASDDTKQVQEFIELNNMFDGKSESTLSDMRSILNDTQANIKTNTTPSGGSGSTLNISTDNSLSSSPPVGLTTTNNSVNPLTLSSTDSTVTSIDDSTQDVELYNDLKSQTTSITDTLQQKINSSSSSSAPAMNVSTSVKSGGTSFNLQTPSSTGSVKSPSESIDKSKPSINNATQLNNNTTSLYKTTVDLSSKIEQLNKQVSSKQPPRIVNIDNTQIAKTTDYLTNSDTVRAMARTRP